MNLASKILCIFVTGGAYAPYAPCLSTPLIIILNRKMAQSYSLTGHK